MNTIARNGLPVFLGILVFLASFEGTSAAPKESAQAHAKFIQRRHQKEWSAFLARIKPGTTKADVEEMMKGKYREKGEIVWGGTGSNDMLYRIDDFFHVRFSFDGPSRLRGTGVLERSRRWLRFPDGTVFFAELPELTINEP